MKLKLFLCLMLLLSFTANAQAKELGFDLDSSKVAVSSLTTTGTVIFYPGNTHICKIAIFPLAFCEQLEQQCFSDCHDQYGGQTDERGNPTITLDEAHCLLNCQDKYGH